MFHLKSHKRTNTFIFYQSVELTNPFQFITFCCGLLGASSATVVCTNGINKINHSQTFLKSDPISIHILSFWFSSQHSDNKLLVKKSADANSQQERVFVQNGGLVDFSNVDIFCVQPLTKSIPVPAKIIRLSVSALFVFWGRGGTLVL